MPTLMFDDLPRGAPTGLKFDDLPAPSVASDVATQVAGHLAEAPENVLSAPANLANVAGHGLTWLANKIAPNSDFAKNWTKQQQDQDQLASSIQQNAPLVSNVVPAAQTTAGKYASSVVDFAPAALLPGTALQRVMRAVKPGVASEVAGEEANKVAPDYSTAARVAAAVLAGGKGSVSKPISSSTVLELANKNYDAFRNSDVSLDHNTVSSWAKGLQNDMYNQDFESSPTYNLLNKYASADRPMPLSKLQTLHERLVNNAASTGSDGEAARFAKSNLDNFIPSLQPTDAINNGQNLPAAVAAWQAGKQNAFVGNTMKAVEDRLYRADLNTASAGTADNGDNALRAQLKPLLLNTKLKGRFQGADKQSIEDTIKGGTGINAARIALSMVNGHNNFLFPLIGAEALGHVAGPIGELAGGAGIAAGTRTLGHLLSKVTARQQRNNVSNFLNVLASRGVGTPQPGASTSPLLAKVIAASLAANQSR